jgi:hypothetical protein
VVVAGFALFGVLYTGLGIFDPRLEPTGVAAAAVTVAFIATLLLPILLGFALIRRRDFRVPVVSLLAPLVVFPLTLVLDAVSTWAHPAYPETVVNFGVALLVVAALEARTTPAGEVRQRTLTYNRSRFSPRERGDNHQIPALSRTDAGDHAENG